MDPTVIDFAFKSLEILSIIVGVAVFVFKLGRATEKFEQIAVSQGREIADLKKSIEQMGDILIKQALQSERIDQLGKQVQLIDTRMEELRHGEGFVYPLTASFPRKA